LARYQHHNLLNISQYSILELLRHILILRLIFSEIQWETWWNTARHGETSWDIDTCNAGTWSSSCTYARKARFCKIPKAIDDINDMDSRLL
jgi:hypothetical protein